MFLRISISCIILTMIFFDATGKRWRKIKLSAAGVTALAVIPVGLLGVGTLAYQPKWGRLPVISQARNLVDQAAGIATQQVAAATRPASSPSPKPSASAKPSRRLASTTTTRTSTPAPAPTVLAAQTQATPHVKATPAPTPTATPTTAPGNSGGHSKSSHSPNH